MASPIEKKVLFEFQSAKTNVNVTRWDRDEFEVSTDTKGGFLDPRIEHALGALSGAFYELLAPALPDHAVNVGGVRHRRQRWLFVVAPADEAAFMAAIQSIFMR